MLTGESKRLFPLDPDIIYLNHGAFGVTPHDVLNQKKRFLSEIEANPVDILQYEFRGRWQQTSNAIAKRFSCDENSVAIVDNATDGAVAVLRSLSLKPDDEILITQLTYSAIALAARHIAEAHRAKVTVATIRFPDPDPQQCIESVEQALTGRTRLVILDHITSSAALLLPLREIIDACRAHGVRVLVDGAHAPGQIKLDIPALRADWYVANLHKWYFVPRGCGFLWAAASAHTGLVPNVLSSDIIHPFPRSFGWTGTRDPSSWLTVPNAFDFMDRFGEGKVRHHNHELPREATALLADMWKFNDRTPDAMRACMGLIPTPDGLPYPPTDQGRTRLETDLKDNCKIVVNSSIVDHGRIWLRISAQIYNGIRDYEQLGHAVFGLQ
jgi:isopenicillin-N epimerase